MTPWRVHSVARTSTTKTNVVAKTNTTRTNEFHDEYVPWQDGRDKNKRYGAAEMGTPQTND
jgi:hypothetical protein